MAKTQDCWASKALLHGGCHEVASTLLGTQWLGQSQDVHVPVSQSSPPWRLCLCLWALWHIPASLPHCGSQIVGPSWDMRWPGSETTTTVIRSPAQVITASGPGWVLSTWANKHESPQLPEHGQPGGWKGLWNLSGKTNPISSLNVSSIVPNLWLILLWEHFCKSLKYKLFHPLCPVRIGRWKQCLVFSFFFFFFNTSL